MIESRDGDYGFLFVPGKERVEISPVYHDLSCCKSLQGTEICKMFGKMRKSQVFDCLCDLKFTCCEPCFYW